MEIPKLETELLLNVDATPDKNYVLRILQAHRQNCNCKYEVHGLSEGETKLWDTMNELQDQRIKLLDEAIEKLN